MDTTTAQSLFDDATRTQRAHTTPSSREAAVAELGKAALGGLDVPQVFDLATELLCMVMGVEVSTVLQRTSVGESLVVVAAHGCGNRVQVGKTTVPGGNDSQAGHTLLIGEPVIVSELAGERRFTAASLLTDLGIVSGISVVIPDKDEPFGVLAVHAKHRRRFTSFDTDFLRSVANVIGAALQNGRHLRQIESQAHSQDRQVRYQSALAECAEALLVSAGDDRLQQAAAALLKATDVDYVFIERNITDPELGFCSQTVAEFERPGTPGEELENVYWKVVPWAEMPMSRSHLERGEPFVVIPEELEGPEYELYAADPFPIKSELDIPIYANGEWAGLIAFADISLVREWTDEDLSLLTTAARMIGAFWEREMARDRMRRLLRSKNELIASISHELRTPLTAVVGFAEILRKEDSGLSTKERADVVNTIAQQGVDLSNMIDDLLVAAKAEAGTLTVVQVPVDLRAQAAQVLESWGPDEASQVELVGNASRGSGDPSRVRQIIRNLVSNALRYGGDTIRVDASNDASMARVAVADNGPGIDPEDRERIFEAYQRAKQAPGLAGSVGLGLNISHQLAHLMGGDLTYRYEAGESIFELVLPKVP